MRRAWHVPTIAVVLSLLTLPCLAAQDSPQPRQPRPIVRDVRIDAVTDDYDLEASMVRVVGQMAHTAEHRTMRRLPIATSMSSYGR